MLNTKEIVDGMKIVIEVKKNPEKHNPEKVIKEIKKVCEISNEKLEECRSDMLLEDGIRKLDERAYYSILWNMCDVDSDGGRYGYSKALDILDNKNIEYAKEFVKKFKK